MIARTMGSKNSFAQVKAQRIKTRYANPVSFPYSNGFLESVISDISVAARSLGPFPASRNSIRGGPQYRTSPSNRARYRYRARARFPPSRRKAADESAGK